MVYAFRTNRNVIAYTQAKDLTCTLAHLLYHLSRYSCESAPVGSRVTRELDMNAGGHSKHRSVENALVHA